MKLHPLLLVAAAGVGIFLATQSAEPVADAATDAGQAASDVVEDGQVAVARFVAPIVGTVQGAGVVVSEALPAPARADTVHPAAVDLIVGFEISSEAYYVKRLQGVICPGGASGPTFGIGYDGGHQSAAKIRRDWAMHPDVERLASTAGAIGPAACAAARDRLRDVRIPLDMAKVVFASTMLPDWLRATRRTYPGVEQLGRLPEGVLVGNTMNRGTTMVGPRAIEKRAVRDTCIPRVDVPCTAHQVRLSCRVWRGTELEAGLCRRRFAEADLIAST